MAWEVKNIGTERALQKIRHYCGYSERTHREVRDKLYGFGLRKPEVEQLLSQMIEEDYLNEERFAMAFAGGKFRMKHWGRVKIKYEMKQKGISEYCIKKGLKEIPEDDYLATLQKLCDQKSATLKDEKNKFTRMSKLQNYLAGKGYEFNLIKEVMENSDK